MPLVFHLGNSQVSVYRTIGPTLVIFISLSAILQFFIINVHFFIVFNDVDVCFVNIVTWSLYDKCL